MSWNHQTVRGRSHSAQINGDRGVPIGYTSCSITCHSANPWTAVKLFDPMKIPRVRELAHIGEPYALVIVSLTATK